MSHLFMRMTNSLITSFCALAITLFVSGCGFDASHSIREDVLVYCSEASPQSFNPQLVSSGPTFDASSRQIYNRLIEFQPGSSLLKPSLATNWQISKDGKEYTFEIRRNVTFQQTRYFKPTRFLNADDVIFTFMRQWLPSHPFHNISHLNFRYFESMGLRQLITNIEKLDDYHVKFTLSNPESPFLATLAMDFASILSAEYADKLISENRLSDIDNLPIGTGPFKLHRYQIDAYIRYLPHETYWKGKEKIRELVFAITPDPSLRFARLVAGECDIMASPLPIHINASEGMPKLTVLDEPGSNVSYLSLNTAKPPFDNPDVRRALNYAINKSSLIKIVYDNKAQMAKNPIPPNMWSYNEATNAIPYSPAKAKQLLKKAGFENGFTMDLWAMPVQRSYNPNAIKMAELIQQDLLKVNIDARIVSYEFGTYLEKVKNGEHLAALLGWIGDNGDPDNFFTSLLSCDSIGTGNNASYWCDPRFDQLINKASVESDVRKRTQLYQQAQMIFSESLPWVPIAHSNQFVVLNKRVQNFHLTPMDGMYFSGVTLAHSEPHGPENKTFASSKEVNR